MQRNKNNPKARNRDRHGLSRHTKSLNTSQLSADKIDTNQKRPQSNLHVKSGIREIHSGRPSFPSIVQMKTGCG